MDILFVTRPIISPWNEGSKNLTWQVASSLQSHQAHLLTVRNVKLSENLSSVKWQRPYTHHHLSTWQKIRLLYYLWRLPKSIDLLHYFFVPTPISSKLLSYLSKRSQVPTVQTVPTLPNAIQTPAEARRLFFADQIVTYTKETAVSLRQLGLNNINHINVGIDEAKFAPPEGVDRKQLRHQFKLPESATLMLYAGEYTRLGAVDQLRRIMPLVLAQCSDCHFLFSCRLLLSTDAGIKTVLQQWVVENGFADRIHFLEEVSEFPSLLHAVDIFLYPATDMVGKIDTPLTILEAMAAELPVLAYRERALPELFGQERNQLIQTGDVEEMVKAIVAFAQDAELRSQTGKQLRQIVRERYTVQRMVAAYEELYDNLA